MANKQNMYETKSIKELHELLVIEKDDVLSLLLLLEKAHDASKIMNELITETFVRDYLDDKFEPDSLTDIRKKVGFDGECYSRSHLDWLYELSRAKLEWSRNKDEQTKTLIRLTQEFAEVQKLSNMFSRLLKTHQK